MKHKNTTLQKAVLIGGGYWGQILKRYICEVYDVLAYCDSKTPHKTLESALQAADVAFIATPLPSHFSLAMLALQHHCDVFVEKPTTQSLSELDTLYTYAAAQGCIVFTNYIYTFSRSIAHAIHLAKDAQIHSIQAHITQYGKFYNNESVIEVLGVHYMSVFALMQIQGIYSCIALEECRFLDSNRHSANLYFKAMCGGRLCDIELHCSLLSQHKSRILHIHTLDSTLRVDMLSQTPLTATPTPHVSPPHSLVESSTRKLPIYDESNNIALALEDFKHIQNDTNAYEAHIAMCRIVLELLCQAHKLAKYKDERDMYE